MWRKLSITRKLTAVLALFAAGVLAIVGVLAYSNNRAALQAAAIASLESAAIEKEAALDAWLNDHVGDLVSLTRSPALLQAVTALVAAPRDSDAALAAHDRVVAELAAHTGGQTGFMDVMVIEPREGQVIAATDANVEGQFKEDRPYFVSGRRAPFVQNVYYSVQLQAPAITVSAPLQNAQGELVAVLAAHLKLAELQNIIQRRSGLRESEDALLVNASHLLVTQPRFLPDPAVLQRGVRTEAVNRCLEGKSGAAQYADFSGVPVIGVYHWRADREVCLIVKVEQQEAFAPAQAFTRTLLGVGAVLAVSVIFAAALLARTFTRPILALQQGAARFGAGELDARLSETGGDELSKLAREFNLMANALAHKDAELRSYAVGLEYKVAERTVQLQASEAELRALFEAMDDVILVLDDAGRYLEIAPTNPDLLYRPAAEVLGKTVLEIFPPDLAESFLAAIRSVVTTRARARFEYALELRGETKFFEATISPLEERSVLWVARDVTERERAQEQARKSERNLALAQEISHIGSWEFSFASGALWWSDEAYRIYGFEPRTVKVTEELFFGCIHPADRAAMGEWVQNALQGTPPPGAEFRVVRPDGTERIVFGQGVVSFDARGAPVNLCGTVWDITERKRAEEALRLENERFLRFFDSNIVGVVIADAHGGVLMANDYYLNVLGVTRADFERGEVDWVKFTPPEWLPVDDKAIRELRECGVCEPYEKEYVRADGRRIPVFIADAMLPGPGDQIAAFVLDISDRKRAQAALLQLNQELEARVRQRTAELEFANQELEAFAYSVSHDLRAPLRAIDGFARILTDEYAGELSADAQRYLGLVRANARQMGMLVDDLLTFSRMNRQPLAKQRVVLAPLVNQALDELASQRDGRRFEVTVSELPDCDADPRLLKQVWLNLLSNAFKFTRPRETAVVEIGAVTSGKGQVTSDTDGLLVTRHLSPVTYFVRDNGVGFDMRYADKLFGVFQRLHRAEDFEGTGVGLAIVERIVHRHGGRVWAESTLGEGTTFYFSLG